MSSFYSATVEELLIQTEEYLLARLEVGYAQKGFIKQFTEQTLIWARDIRALRLTLQRAVEKSQSAKSWGVLLEFSIPRKEKRIDIVLLIRNVIVIVEGKSAAIGSEARKQLQEYALLLHYFHKASQERRIVPILVAPIVPDADLRALWQGEIFPQLPTFWIAPITLCSWAGLDNLLVEIETRAVGEISIDLWNDSPYWPVPSIIEAAVALRSGLSIREIAHSEASEHEIADVRQTIQNFVNQAKAESLHAICFLTGVPGSGKTLVGLSLAHAAESKANAIHFMSGNGPLVQVLQHLFTREAQRKGSPAVHARMEARTLLENVHVFAKYHTETNLGSPSNHAIIFDEAQRAWNQKQNLKKFKRNYSEPAMLLQIMERHQDWAVVVALVGGGQEINDGEAGLEEWGRALSGSNKRWIIHASPEVLEGGPSTAGHRLFEDAEEKIAVLTNPSLHLRTSNRSLRAENLATWVNLVLQGDAQGAAALRITDRFPVFLSRSLKDTRTKLQRQGLVGNRFGLVASSGAARLRAEGLEPSSSFHANYPWEHWYLADESDVRSSYKCEVFATEFEIQGLELDWVGLCWGGDLTWTDKEAWALRAFRHGSPAKWNLIKNSDKKIYRQNAYRVLLTRARMGMVIYVPLGDARDPTRNPDEFESTAQYLVKCGVIS